MWEVISTDHFAREMGYYDSHSMFEPRWRQTGICRAGILRFLFLGRGLEVSGLRKFFL